MIEEATMYTSSMKCCTTKPDWQICRDLEQENGEVTTRMIIQRLMVTHEKARKILNRWESMKNAMEIQKRFGNEV